MRTGNSFLFVLFGMLLSSAGWADGLGTSNTAVVNLNGKTYSCTLLGQGGGGYPAYAYPGNPIQDEKVKSCWSYCESSKKDWTHPGDVFKACNKACGVTAGSESVCLENCTANNSNVIDQSAAFTYCSKSCGTSYAPDCLGRCTKSKEKYRDQNVAFKQCQVECDRPLPTAK